MKKLFTTLAFLSLLLPQLASAQQFIPFLKWTNATGTQATTTSLFSDKGNFTSLCISLDCKTAWPTAYTLPTASGSVLGGIKVGTRLSIDGSGVLSADVQSGTGGGLATTTPWTALNLAQVVDNGHVTSIATSTLNLTTSSFLSPNISQWTNNSNFITLGSLSGLFPITYNNSTGVIGSSFSTTTPTGMTANSLITTDNNGTLTASSTIGNNQLQNNSITVTTASPLGGAATVKLGGTLALTCTGCLTSAITTLGDTYHAGLTGATQTLATSTPDTNLGMTIVSSGTAHTFTPYWIGTLADNRIASASTWNAKLSSAITGLKQTYGSTQTGATQTLATSTDTNIGLTITNGGADSFTFTPTWTGTLADGRIASASTWNSKLSTIGSGTNGQLAYWSGTNLLAGTGTSTLSATSPLTGSFTQVGTGGALGIQVANTSQGGYLTNTDWNTFNGKQNTISATWPITLSGATLGFGGISTTTALTSGQVDFSTGTNTIGNSANFLWDNTWNRLTVTNASTTALSVDNGLSGDALTQYGSSSHEWVLGAKISDFTFRISSSTALGTSDVFKADKNLNVFFPNLTSNGFVKTSGSGGQLSIDTSTYTPTSLTLTATSPITGGGDLSTNRSFGFDYSVAGTFTGKQTFGNASSTQFSAGTNTFYIDSNGHMQGKDTVAGWSGVISPTSRLSLQVGTTTTWTGTTSAPYITQTVAPYSGTIQQVMCNTDAGFLNVDIYHTSTHLPLILGASSTVGILTQASNNTFTKGEVIYMAAGTTTTATTKSLSCTLLNTETP